MARQQEVLQFMMSDVDATRSATSVSTSGPTSGPTSPPFPSSFSPSLSGNPAVGGMAGVLDVGSGVSSCPGPVLRQSSFPGSWIEGHCCEVFTIAFSA